MSKIFYGFVSNHEEKENAFTLVMRLKDFDFSYITIENIDTVVNDKVILENDIVYCKKENLRKEITKNAKSYNCIILNFFDIKISEEIKSYINRTARAFNTNFIIVNKDENIQHAFISLDLDYIKNNDKEKLKKEEIDFFNKVRTNELTDDVEGFVKIEEIDDYDLDYEEELRNFEENSEYEFSIKKNDDFLSLKFCPQNDYYRIKCSEGSEFSFTRKEACLLYKIIEFSIKKE